MAIQKFKVGKDEFEIEDDLPFGELDGVMEHAVDLTDPDNPQLSMTKYRLYIVAQSIKKAPFDTTPEALAQLPYSVMSQLVKEVTKYHPLSKYLVDWLMTYLGSQDLSEDVTKSMLSAHNNLVGTKPKLTDSQEST